MIGKTLGHYQIIEKVGAGGMGVVYKARDLHLDRFVALKILPPEKVADAERKRRFVREAKAASALNHPNIVTIHDITQEAGTDFIAMEYVEGKTLAQQIGHRGLRLNDALKYAAQIADALAKAHSAGIVHRDLKPRNVMVNQDGVVKVLDFGLAKLSEQIQGDETASTATIDSEGRPITEEGVIVGTVAYMSPEQAAGRKVDARSDIFSFGSVLYEMVTGQKAFQGTSKVSTLSAILHQEPKPVSGITQAIPADLEKLINRCLRKDPAKRVQHMDDVRLALDELKEDSDSGKIGASAPALKVGRSYPRLSMVAVLVAVLGVAAWFYLGRSHPTPTEAKLTAVPLTSYRGWESYPSFSPDETQVAFQWCQEGQRCHIYIKQIGVEATFPLTNAAADDLCPAWSPDARFIAFLRRLESNRWALIVIPQRGGPEKVLVTWDVSEMKFPLDGPYLAWAPDSKWLVFPYFEEDRQVWALFLICLENGEKRRLTSPPADVNGDTGPALSPDGRILVFSRSTSDEWSDLYLLSLGKGYKPQGQAKRTDTGNSWNLGADWTPDGRDIVFSSGSNMAKGLWRMEVSELGKLVGLPFASEYAFAPSISRSGKRLAYSVYRHDVNIWRVGLTGPGRRPSNPIRLISSTRAELMPAYSPDGTRIAFVSDQSGAPEIWICDIDGRNYVQLTSIGTPGTFAPKWSPDSRSIAFHATREKNTDVYAVSASGGSPQRLTTQEGEDNEPSWSRDGRWLYFVSQRSGKKEIWKMPSQGGEATQVTRTKEDADIPQESADGKFLYYCRGWPFPASSVWRVPVEGGEEVKVLEYVHSNGGWIVSQEGIFFFTAPDDKDLSELCLYEFASGKTVKILKMEKRIEGRIAVSPDGRTVLYAQIDESGSDLMLVENFR